MSAKHTPGPWRAEYGNNNARVLALANVEQEVAAVPTLRSTNAEVGRNRDLMIANARLIAAAPELLEALDGLIGHCLNVPGSGTGEFHRALGRARRAIAKAEAPPVTPDDEDCAKP